MLKNSTENNKILSGSTLKIIAIISMLIDHTAAVLVSPYDFSMLYIIMRLIGRLAFPIFCFLLVEGMYYTSNAKKYLFQLGLFAIISEIPFDLAFYHKIYDSSYQNVFFTLFLGALLIYIIEQLDKKKISYICIKWLCILFICYIAFFLQTDYGYKGIILILCYYFCRYTSYIKLIIVGMAIFLLYGFDLEIAAIFSALPIACYNGKRGLKLKYFFYIFYPLHLIILFLIKFTIYS